MAPVIFFCLFGIWLLFIRVITSLDMSNELRLAVNIVMGIGAFLFPLFTLSYIDMKLTKRQVDSVGNKWCEENNLDFVKVDIYKNHFALVYKNNGTKLRKKFRVKFKFTTWFVKDVEWVESNT